MSSNTKEHKQCKSARKEIHIAITARRWFQKLYGKTYHSVKISILKDGMWEVLGTNNFEYGGNGHYLHSATRILVKHRLLPDDVYQICPHTAKNYDMSIFETVVDVQRKKDLIF